MLRAAFLALSLFLASIPVETPAQSAPAFRPFADYEHTAILAMSALDQHGAAKLKHQVLQHLPSNVSVVLYGPSAADNDRHRILSEYGRSIAISRLHYVAIPKAKNGFWSRDVLPVPLIGPAGELVLIDARYWTGFEPDAVLGELFDAPLLRHPHRFEGGNFAANHYGECLTVRTSQTNKMSDEVFRTMYGCRTTLRLPRKGGIGHIDERARFVDARTVVTDTTEYEAILSSRGFRTVRLPRSAGRFETYANALFVNGTAFVPQFGRSTDIEALQVYRDLGFAVVGVNSRTLSSRGLGSIHCLIMNYPAVRSRTFGLDQLAIESARE